MVFYEIHVNVILTIVNGTSLLDGVHLFLSQAEDKLIAVTIYLGCSNDQNNLIVRDCPSTQKKTPNPWS